MLNFDNCGGHAQSSETYLCNQDQRNSNQDRRNSLMLELYYYVHNDLSACPVNTSLISSTVNCGYAIIIINGTYIIYIYKLTKLYTTLIH